MRCPLSVTHHISQKITPALPLPPFSSHLSISLSFTCLRDEVNPKLHFQMLMNDPVCLTPPILLPHPQTSSMTAHVWASLSLHGRLLVIPLWSTMGTWRWGRHTRGIRENLHTPPTSSLSGNSVRPFSLTSDSVSCVPRANLQFALVKKSHGIPIKTFLWNFGTYLFYWNPIKLYSYSIKSYRIEFHRSPIGLVPKI